MPEQLSYDVVVCGDEALQNVIRAGIIIAEHRSGCSLNEHVFEDATLAAEAINPANLAVIGLYRDVVWRDASYRSTAAGKPLIRASNTCWVPRMLCTSTPEEDYPIIVRDGWTTQREQGFFVSDALWHPGIDKPSGKIASWLVRRLESRVVDIVDRA